MTDVLHIIVNKLQTRRRACVDENFNVVNLSRLWMIGTINWRDWENSICDIRDTLANSVQILFELFYWLELIVETKQKENRMKESVSRILYFKVNLSRIFVRILRTFGKFLLYSVIGSRVIERCQFDFDCSVLASWRQCSFVAFRRYAGRIWVGGSSFAIGLRDPRPWRIRSRIRGPHTSFRSAATPVLSQQPWYFERSCQSGCEFR